VHDLSDSKPGKEGIMPVFSIENREKEQYFGYEFAGFIHIEKAGSYTFFLTTNDGSRLYVDDMMVINNDGLHPAAEVSRQLNLAEGYHSFLIRYFQEGGTHHFQLEWQGPGFERQIVPASVLYHEKE
jgi:alpha-L-fucosidase